MPLVKAALEAGILAACSHVEKEFTKEQFAAALASAIHDYVSAITITAVQTPGAGVTACPAGPGTVVTPAPITITVM